ncbi:tripartite tricarboxylate transporter TctB family protein [Sabulicella rubraurantiaca]|uniref:tripartite tricarboxylate transporter TctB family protein n=1 Tax=Sabulicella rubraurantiaca TaxID=2811429 RepID=UPI001A95A350|nr:tripartite tricarboxylate transporter TctB family protein [Sabulicella rubraurantiaca]
MAWNARLVAIASLAFAALAGWEAARLPAWSQFDGPGPGLLPQILAALIAVAAIGVLVAPGTGEPEGGNASPLRSRGFLGYAGAMVGVGLALPYLGFGVTGFLATLLVLRVAEGAGWGLALFWSFTLVIAVTLVFGTALGVPFPPGPVERLLAPLGLVRLG